jgi:sugar lactone lactonase YvrE
VEQVTDSVAGTRMVFCNNAAVASDGTVWFSDSSTRYGLENWKDDFVQATRTGRLLRLDTDGRVDVVLDGLAFANGVALAADESYVAVAATGPAPAT